VKEGFQIKCVNFGCEAPSCSLLEDKSGYPMSMVLGIEKYLQESLNIQRKVKAGV
jgi:hypothetical protein